MAKNRGVELLSFDLEDFDVPYGYTPCLLSANKYTIPGSPEEEGMSQYM